MLSLVSNYHQPPAVPLRVKVEKGYVVMSTLFCSSCSQGTILFRSNAKEALQKAQEAAGGTELKIKDEAVQWEVLEGDGELETLKKIIESQQESLNKRKGGRGLVLNSISSLCTLLLLSSVSRGWIVIQKLRFLHK